MNFNFYLGGAWTSKMRNFSDKGGVVSVFNELLQCEREGENA